jgi:N-acyl homoserine lactone hydrolase
MELYFFKSGILKSQKQYFTAGRGLLEPFDVPVPYFLIKHPKGHVMFDTGNALEVAQDKRKHWGGVVDAYDPIMEEDEWCINQIRKVGVEPEDIKYVILSHLHLDHAGGVGHFPNAKYVVQREEMYYAYVPDFFMKGAYIRADFDKDVDWFILEGWRNDKFDLYGDGSLIIYFTPGHTPGHQSLLVNLEEAGPMFLTADACYTTENIDEDVLPGLCWGPSEAIRSIDRMRYLRDQFGVKIITGHDPAAWEKVKKAPDFYK